MSVAASSVAPIFARDFASVADRELVATAVSTYLRLTPDAN